MSVPTLRFPEFSGEWEDIKGKEIFNVLGGGAFSSKDSRDNGVKWLKIANVGINKIKSNDLSYLPIEYQKEYVKYLLKKEDIVIALTRPILSSKLKIALIDDYFDNSLLNQRVGKLIPGEKGVKNFIYYLLQLKKTIAYIENQISGTDPPNLSIKDLINIPLMVPAVIEQQKIASFLSKVDSKIEKLEKKQELLETYKKGMMQQIFSQKLRFKDENGEDYPDWEEKKLGDILNIKYGKDYKHLDEGTIPVLGTGGVMTHVNDYLYDKASVLIGRKGTINKPIFIKEPFWTVDTLFYTEINGADPNFTFYLALTINWLKYNEASGVPSLSAENIKKILIELPSCLEQSKIADFLSAIENKIENINEELEINKEFKKGLLQQMFC